MRIKARIATIVLLSITTGCASFHKGARELVQALELVEHVAPAPPPKEASDVYKKSYALLQQEKFQEAYDGFQNFLRNDPVSPWTQAANLNSGRALEGLERWSDAGATYRTVIAATSKAPKLQAMALYRLSYCYEALGDEQQVVAVLNDLLSRLQYLPEEVGAAELPARLGGAYARVGNFDRAVELYRRAEFGIAKLRRTANGEVPEWLPRTLFLMGEMSRRRVSWDGFAVALRPLTRAQIYLLQAAELGKEPWAERAANELIAVYRDLIQVIETAPAPDGDPLLAERDRQKQQWDRSVLVLDTIAELRARSVPGSSKQPAVGAIMKAASEIEKRVQELLLERPAGEGLTREAINRKSGGTYEVVDPDDSLEQKFIKSSREIDVILPAKPSEDPNL